LELAFSVNGHFNTTGDAYFDKNVIIDGTIFGKTVGALGPFTSTTTFNESI
jgi:hypothetical protein